MREKDGTQRREGELHRQTGKVRTVIIGGGESGKERMTIGSEQQSMFETRVRPSVREKALSGPVDRGRSTLIFLPLSMADASQRFKTSLVTPRINLFGIYYSSLRSPIYLALSPPPRLREVATHYGNHDHDRPATDQDEEFQAATRK